MGKYIFLLPFTTIGQCVIILATLFMFALGFFFKKIKEKAATTNKNKKAK